MVGESLAIIAVIIVLAVMVARRGKHRFAAITLPLVSIPALHLVGRALRMNSLPWNIAGLLIGVALCILSSRKFSESRSVSVAYLFFCLFFLIGLFIAYWVNLT